MKDEFISKSKTSKSNNFLVILGISFFIYLGYNVNKNDPPTNEYEENLTMIFTSLLILVVLYFIYYILNQKKVIVYDKYFEVKRMLSAKRYFYSEIETHYSEQRKGKYNSWTEYYIVLKSGKKIKLLDSEYSNFHDFFSQIKKRINKNDSKNIEFEKKEYLKYSILSGTIACVLLISMFSFIDNKKISNDNFIYIQTKLSSDISIAKKYGKRLYLNRKYFVVKLVEHPEFDFKVTENEFNSVLTKKKIITTFRKGENIIVGIEKDEYLKKITKQKPLNLSDKYLNYSEIQIRQLKDLRNNYYIDIEKVNRLRIEDNYVAIGLFSVFILLFLILTAGNYNAYKKSTKNHT